MKYRVEYDTLGEVKVPIDKYWGAQTQRSLENFRIGPEASMPIDLIRAYGYVKKAAAYTNHQLGILSLDKRDLISAVCDEIIQGYLDEHFPLVIWQTGSGTQTNMNVNEVISNRAHVLKGNELGKGVPFLHSNDDVNKSQSSNDTFPTAMHIAAHIKLVNLTIPSIKSLRNALDDKAKALSDVIKVGRTHLMDATPLTMGQEFTGYVSQLDHAIQAIHNSLSHLREIALGGTAVGTGLNAPANYGEIVTDYISKFTGLSFRSAENKFEAIASHDALVEAHGALKQTAVSLLKIANDIRLMASGPRAGIGELIIPSNEPGSSIMPGKVNPTQVEALSMVCAQVMGNDTTITIAGSSGQFELNVFKPLIIYNFLQSAQLLGDACVSFTKNCVEGLRPDKARIKGYLDNSLMLITALNTHIGYEKSAEIAKKAYAENKSLRESALELGYVSQEEFDKWVDPKKMI
ncbi:class II fumarate hydratase [Ancylomarina salipaludis]|uniref:Fumarate hydratase class II n=1 Tax=Ancylomarina salipaludis TaxID=2501299 RepID=A0A4Q1JLY3_9BACT|nr:class II fumarate hydratase [Ancylomarina salipaludis]RXQ94966.1 class II fumarate hydratase [Ancylomarina salipaludis]